MRQSFALLMLLLLPAYVLGQEFKMEPAAKSPQESLKCIKLRPGFKAELMVAEPLVQSPIAFAWGPDGKFWIVEMGDYPLGVDGKGKPGGKIKFLEKSQPDGPYDKMTVFMDGLGFPTGVMPYGKGVLVTCAPDIFYAEDTKGTGKADKKEILFTGFKEGNQQHRVNGLRWGIDNWIYGANGDSGGTIKSLQTGKTVIISGRDFRFKVKTAFRSDTGAFEAVSGQSQFGRCRDDWGNWFGNNNSNPMYHYVLEDDYIKRNPHVLYPDPRVPVSVHPGAAEIFPISKPLPRFNSPQALNHFTSACSTIIYRDTLFGKDFEGNSFVSEPVHNLIHREIMKPKGVTFTSQRADDEQKSEFLASSDNWFRPTMIQVGPDGALWVADMYRYVIEHPEWIPKDWQKKLDLRAGQDKGRIYRIYPTDKKPRALVRMDTMKIEELVKQLESPSGWVRDTAHRLLVLDRFAEAKSEKAAAALQTILEKSTLPQARLHALYVYHAGVGSLNAKMMEKILADPHPGVRKNAVAVLSEQGLSVDAKFVTVLEMDDDPVRQQLAYVSFYIGDLKNPYASRERLIRLLFQNADNRYIVAAGLSSITKSTWYDVFREVRKQEKIPDSLLGPLLRLAKAYGTPLEFSYLFVQQLATQEKLPIGAQLASTAEMLDAVEQSNTTLKKLLQDVGEMDIQHTLAHLGKIHAEGVKIVADPKAALSERMIALRLLGRGLGNDREDHKILAAFLTPQTPDDVQATVIQQLGRTGDPRAIGLLLSPWKSYSPKLRGQVMDLLLSRTVWARLTLEALQKKQVPANEIDAIRRERFLHHRDEEVRALARKVFVAASNRDRAQVVDEYWLRLPDKADKERGAKLFAKSCATCHQFGGSGQPVGPDLASVGDKSPQGLLTAILDPNRAVEARYINYLAVTKKGLSYNGVLASETSTSITLVGPDGKQYQLLRNELEELSSTGKSLMPEGLEKDLSPQDLADIIEYVRGNQQAPKRKEFPGNQPEKVSADKEGTLYLLPKNGAIYGPKIIIEKQYGNLGWWSSPEDHVIWTIETAKVGDYEVWIDYACANDSAGNTLAIRSGTASVLYKVAATGSWDNYFGRKIGVLSLPAGTQQITVRSEGTLRNALIDLRVIKLMRTR